MGAASSESDVSPSRRHVTFSTVFSFVDLCHNAVVSPNLRNFPHEDGRLTSYPQPFHISWHTARDSFVVSLVEVAWATNSEEAVNSFSSKLRCSVNLSIWLNGMQWITWQLWVHRDVLFRCWSSTSISALFIWSFQANLWCFRLAPNVRR